MHQVGGAIDYSSRPSIPATVVAIILQTLSSDEAVGFPLGVEVLESSAMVAVSCPPLAFEGLACLAVLFPLDETNTPTESAIDTVITVTDTKILLRFWFHHDVVEGGALSSV